MNIGREVLTGLEGRRTLPQDDVEPSGAPRGGPERAGRRAVVILASGEAAELADRLRHRRDIEWFERVPPHVSLLGPFEPAEPDEKIASRLAEELRGLRPFSLGLGTPGTFIVPELVLYLSVETDAQVRELERRVRRAFPSWEPPRPFSPHLTIGRFASQGGLLVALKELDAELAKRTPGSPVLGFQVEEIHVFKENPGTGVYCSAARLPLGA